MPSREDKLFRTAKLSVRARTGSGSECEPEQEVHLQLWTMNVIMYLMPRNLKCPQKGRESKIKVLRREWHVESEFSKSRFYYLLRNG